MIDTKVPLIAEFLKDHQQMTRLLYSISQLLEQRKFKEARARGKELDVIAGPHIAYEECELYPRLMALGERRVKQETLVGQHDEVKDALAVLVERESLDDELLADVLRGFRVGLDHAAHCGSLISLMSRLSAQEQNESLACLRELRERGQKWTELSR